MPIEKDLVTQKGNGRTLFQVSYNITKGIGLKIKYVNVYNVFIWCKHTGLAVLAIIERWETRPVAYIDINLDIAGRELMLYIDVEPERGEMLIR